MDNLFHKHHLLKVLPFLVYVLASISNIFGGGIWGILIYNNILSSNRDSSLFSIYITSISFSYLISITRVSKTTLDRMKEKGLNNLNMKVSRRLMHMGGKEKTQITMVKNTGIQDIQSS